MFINSILFNKKILKLFGFENFFNRNIVQLYFGVLNL